MRIKSPTLMSGMQLIGHGDLDQLVLCDDILVPTPGPTDVLIKVRAAGVNNTDLNTRLGWYSKSDGVEQDASWSGQAIVFPRIQGADVCGIVVACGQEVDSSLLQKRVIIEPCIIEAAGNQLDKPWYFGSECDGGFAEYTVVAARHAYPITSDLSDVELASFPCSYSTAENLLTRAQVTKDDTILITGASGGVGSAVVQLAKTRGAEVIAITAPSKSERLAQLGADRVLSRDLPLKDQLKEERVDVVIDLVAGKQWPALLEILKPFGRYATAGAIAGPHVELDVRTLYLNDLTLMGCTILGKEVFSNLVKKIESGAVRPIVAKTYSLSEVSEAQKDFVKKKHIGKLVIDLSKS